MLSGFTGRVTQAAIRALDWVAERTLPPENIPKHQQTGRRGEEDAYFYLRRQGYVMVSRNYRSCRRRGEIDLIGWETAKQQHIETWEGVGTEADTNDECRLVVEDFLNRQLT